MSTDDNIRSAVERHEIDPILKEVLTFSFGELGVPIQTQVEISRLPLRGLSLEERLRGLNLDAETLEKLKELINGQDGVSS